MIRMIILACFFILSVSASMFGKCIQDKECKSNEYCDHKWPNPIGECKVGTKNGDKCVLDRHCTSKVCHTFKCVGRRPVKDGPCQKNSHDECLPEQFCNKDKCKDRKCNGWCKQSYECMSGKCELFRCKKIPSCK